MNHQSEYYIYRRVVDSGDQDNVIRCSLLVDSGVEPGRVNNLNVLFRSQLNILYNVYYIITIKYKKNK